MPSLRAAPEEGLEHLLLLGGPGVIFQSLAAAFSCHSILLLCIGSSWLMFLGAHGAVSADTGPTTTPRHLPRAQLVIATAGSGDCCQFHLAGAKSLA